MNKTSLAFFIFAGLILWFFFSPQKTTVETLIVGTSADYPPFEYIENNEIVGFEIDLIKEVARRLNKKIEIKDLPFDTLLQELQLGKIQVIASALTETPERASRVLFTPAYSEGDPFLIISRKDNPLESINDIINKNKKIIVNEGYSSDLYISKMNNIDTIRLKSPAEAFLSLTTKNGDAYIITKNMAQNFFNKNSQEDYVIKEIEETGDSYSLAVSKLHSNLLAPIAATLENMKNDNTIDALKEKWNVS